MSITLNLSGPMQALLQYSANREARTPEEVISDLLMERYGGGERQFGAIEEDSPEEDEAIREGLADIAAGRYRTLDRYVDDLQTRHKIEL